jgi:hypothetical protein
MSEWWRIRSGRADFVDANGCSRQNCLKTRHQVTGRKIGGKAGAAERIHCGPVFDR